MVAALVAGCLGGDDDAAAPKRGFAFSPGEGRDVAIDGDRSLRLLCVGSGTPTVVISAGAIDKSAAIRDELARMTRTCAYDRAGEGYSPDFPRLPTDARDDLGDLEKLLQRAHLPAPYLLVGFSYESPAVSLFAKAHPDQTAGVVLLDGLGPDFRRRVLALGRGQPARVQRRLRHDVGPSVVGGLDEDAIAAQAASVTTLGDTPLAVVSVPFAHAAPPSVRGAVARLWMTLQDELAALSTNRVHVVATRSSELVMSDAPRVVIRAVRAVVEAARTGNPLPPCPQVFRGPDVRCRS
jgi:pimeloyl-ACP methyl ester carboxylesterase